MASTVPDGQARDERRGPPEVRWCGDVRAILDGDPFETPANAEEPEAAAAAMAATLASS